MILTSLEGIKSCIPSLFLQKIMHTLVYVAGISRKSSISSCYYIGLHQIQHNMKMIPKLVDKGKGVG